MTSCSLLFKVFKKCTQIRVYNRRCNKHYTFFFFISTLSFSSLLPQFRSPQSLSHLALRSFLSFLHHHSYAVRIQLQSTRYARDNIRRVISRNSRFFARYDVCRKMLVIKLFVTMKPEHSQTGPKLRLLIILKLL